MERLAPPPAPTDKDTFRAALLAFSVEEEDPAAYQRAIDAIADEVVNAPDQMLDALAANVPEFASSPVISIVDESWLAGAVVQDGRVLHADASLQPVGEGLVEIAGRASRRRAFGTLRLADGSLAVAVAAKAGTAASWPLGAALRAALPESGRASVVLCFAPGRHEGVARLIESAFGLTPAEARLAAVLFRGASAEAAAAELGISAETARKRARLVLRKAGALRRADLIARIAELLAGHYLRGRSRSELMQEAFALTAAEAAVSEAVALGLTVREIAERRRVSGHTVRAQLDSALLKTGVARASDLARILINLCALVSWTSCSEPQRQDQRLLIAATRMVPAEGARRIAAADYGPAGAPPILCFHPGLSYRWVRRRLREAFAARGFRTISYDRAACGLSDPAEGHPYEIAADDAARVLDRFRIARTRVFASFGGAGPAIAFAARHPDRVSEAVLLMPRPPRSVTTQPAGLTGLWQAFADKPAVAQSFYEAFRLIGGSRFWRWLQKQVAVGTPADRATMQDDSYNDERMTEIYASIARTVRGTLDLDRATRAGWTPPGPIGGARWIVATTAATPHRMMEHAEEIWSALPGLALAAMPQAGRFAMHTHAGEIAALFSPP